MSEIGLMDLVDHLYAHNNDLGLEYEQALAIAKYVLKFFDLEEKDGLEEEDDE